MELAIWAGMDVNEPVMAFPANALFWAFVSRVRNQGESLAYGPRLGLRCAVWMHCVGVLDCGMGAEALGFLVFRRPFLMPWSLEYMVSERSRPWQNERLYKVSQKKFRGLGLGWPAIERWRAGWSLGVPPARSNLFALAFRRLALLLLV